MCIYKLYTDWIAQPPIYALHWYLATVLMLYKGTYGFCLLPDIGWFSTVILWIDRYWSYSNIYVSCPASTNHFANQCFLEFPHKLILPFAAAWLLPIADSSLSFTVCTISCALVCIHVFCHLTWVPTIRNFCILREILLLLFSFSFWDS